MRRPYSFHRDHCGHSITVNIRAGRITETELLVDGKEVGFQREHGLGTLPRVLAGELPNDPAGAFQVRIDRPARGSTGLACVLVIGDDELPMADRTVPPHDNAMML
ncbi:hypothetical protein [Kitasatospora sp. NPDC050543]|uniref:hypothetical protein n=1 Tax=Kitasatospora sp. NPDC050543 TaxID=3364054 RepID=UPI0037B8C289